MGVVYGKGKERRKVNKSKRAIKKEGRKINRFAKWADLDMDKPEEKKQATASYKAWAGK